MIHHIEGKVDLITPTFAVIDCGGVGYTINISLNTYTKISSKSNCRLLTHLAIKEDAHTLYGFAEEAERKLFRQLITVSGVGANTARLILSSLSPEEAQIAITSGSATTLEKVKGIGLKTAQRIILDLQGKIDLKDITDNSFTSHNKIKEEALAALVMLGFIKNNAEKAITRALSGDLSDISVENVIKLALKYL